MCFDFFRTEDNFWRFFMINIDSKLHTGYWMKLFQIILVKNRLPYTCLFFNNVLHYLPWICCHFLVTMISCMVIDLVWWSIKILRVNFSCKNLCWYLLMNLSGCYIWMTLTSDALQTEAVIIWLILMPFPF